MALGRPAPLPPVATLPGDPRVTILLVMEPGNKGIRRFNKTADPVICETQVCFVSNGAAVPAREMALRKALGPGNTFGKRAGACRGKLACVFRGVTLAGMAPTIQPVDLKVLVHDRREPRTVSGDTSCRVAAGQLTCGRTVTAPGYRAWIVPEPVAAAAGSAALELAVVRGLVASPMREASVKR
jgi:colicin import membrane protein